MILFFGDIFLVISQSVAKRYNVESGNFQMNSRRYHAGSTRQEMDDIRLKSSTKKFELRPVGTTLLNVILDPGSIF
jgi:hypothetical protein